jgi:3-oxoacyl-[acyl-carrier protein] reductase
MPWVCPAAQRSGEPVELLTRRARQNLPAQRFGTAAEFGAICAFLCSRQAGYINGQNILADGGAFPGVFSSAVRGGLGFA